MAFFLVNFKCNQAKCKQDIERYLRSKTKNVKEHSWHWIISFQSFILKLTTFPMPAVFIQYPNAKEKRCIPLYHFPSESHPEAFLVWRNVSIPQWLLIFLISCNLVKMEHLWSIKASENCIKTYDSYRVWWVLVVFLPQYSRVITHNSEKYSIKGEKIRNVPKNKIESPQESFQNNNKKYC